MSARCRENHTSGVCLGHPDVRIVSQKEVQEIEPILRHDILGAIVSPYEGHLNPFLIVNAYIQAAKRLGAEVSTYTKVELCNEG
ncbi:MAG: FAD-binding oxidoreductase [Clostridium sp.]|nr:FAD-binding oxidoreductase [Clostridium sp.]